MKKKRMGVGGYQKKSVSVPLFAEFRIFPTAVVCRQTAVYFDGTFFKP